MLLDVDRILPQEEIKDYTLKMAAKVADNKSQKAEQGKSQQRNLNFWKYFSNKFDSKGTVFENVNSWDTTKDHWKNVSAKFGKSLQYSFVITKDRVQLEFYIGSSDKEYNKKVFDYYYSHKQEIEKDLSNYTVIWERLDEKKASRIALVNKEVKPSNENSWDDISDFFIKALSDFVPVMSKSKYKEEVAKIY